MKKITVTLLIFTTSLLFFGCDLKTNKPQSYNAKETNAVGNPVVIMVIDSCEYVVYPNGNSTWGSHKGNCKFCKQRSEKNK